MSDVSSSNEADKRLATAYTCARGSWLWPLIFGFAVSLLGEVVSPKRMPDVVVYGVGVVLGALGLVAAIYALVTVPGVGARSIRWSALIGATLNLLLLVGGIMQLAKTST